MLLKEWDKVKDVFRKPKPIIYFGFWSVPNFIVDIGRYLYCDSKVGRKGCLNSLFRMVYRVFQPISGYHGLPVWRRGNTIRILKKHQMYICRDNEWVFEWQPEFKEKLDKYHLGWLKTTYQLPKCLSCYFFKSDVIWKWKYDDVRFEYNPYWCLVIFNICFSITWVAPVKKRDSMSNMQYWEDILNYIYILEKTEDLTDNILELISTTSFWEGMDENDRIKRNWNVKPEFMATKVLSDYVKKTIEKMEESFYEREK